jgi:hypothetical protein
MDMKIDESHADFCNLEREVVRILNAAMPQTGREATVMQSRFSAAGWYQIGGWLACCRILTVALLAALATTVMLATAFAASAPDAGVFAVPPPTGDPAADLAAIETAVATAKTWQAVQPKGADGLAAKVEVVLAPGTYSLCPTGGTRHPREGEEIIACCSTTGRTSSFAEPDTRLGSSCSIRTRATSTSSSRAT